MPRIQGDLCDRTFRFAKGVLMLVQQMLNGTRRRELGRQLVRSGTAVGANIREANHAQTRGRDDQRSRYRAPRSGVLAAGRGAMSFSDVLTS